MKLSAKGRDVEISDHALLRWLERAKGIDVEWMRERLRQEVQGAAAAGCTAWRTPDCTFVFRFDMPGRPVILVTVLPAGTMPHNHQRGRA